MMRSCSDTAIQQPHAGAALRTFFALAKRWSLTDDDRMALLAVDSTTLSSWQADPASADLDQGTLQRLSYLFNIWADLQILLPDARAADTWVMRRNQGVAFGGETPLQRMRAGSMTDLRRVAEYTSAWRQIKP